jgi:hypothetical protein
MKTTWTKGLEADAAKVMKAEFLASAILRERLEEIIEQRISNAFEVTRSQYDNPNWQFKQADSAGYKRAMQEIISLLE